jgi:Mor family transcriptional regulator
MPWTTFQRPKRGGSTGVYLSGERARHAKLTDAEVASLRADRRNGMLLRELAAKYGIGESHVSRLVRGLVRVTPW